MVAMSSTAIAAQLERPHRRCPLSREDRPPARASSQAAAAGGASWRSPCRPRAHEHELSQPLRALPHPGLGRRDVTPGPRSDGSAVGPRVRQRLSDAARSKDAGVFRRLSGWGTTPSATPSARPTPGSNGATCRHRGRAGTDAFDTLLDIVIADDLRTVLWPSSPTATTTPGGCGRRCGRPGAMLAGPTPGRTSTGCAGPTTDRLSGRLPAGRRLVAVERAVQMMTEAPATLFGLRDRASWRGHARRLFLFDPTTVGSEPARLVEDLPGAPPALRGVYRCGAGHGQRRGHDRRREPTGSQPGTCSARGAIPTRWCPPRSDGPAVRPQTG